MEFAPDMPWTDEHVRGYAGFISRTVRAAGLRHFDREAVALVVEQGARMSGDREKLSARLRDIVDLVEEAAFWAGRGGHDLVRAQDVEQAVRSRERRAGLVQERVRERIAEGTVMIETAGARVGQVNALSVIDLGDHAFGIPSRVTARVGPGRGSVESIEREIELSGPIHSKGVLTIAGYLAQAYEREGPLPVRATVTFEQSYEEVEGDSASSTELYALLSALSGLPVTQSVAVTGSVNQHGQVQAVGGVTEKIEGFFEVCRARGLTGEQGVAIPAANLRHLTLSAEVAEAVAAGRFQVWAVRNVDEGIELLTGRQAGERGPDGAYPPGSVHALVAERLGRFASEIRQLAGPPAADGRGAQAG